MLQENASAPLRSAGASGWAYVHSYAPFSAADTWPPTLLTALADPQAAKDAKAADAGRILLDLRNALAHGGITYLDKEGQNTEGPAAMLAFAGTKMDRGKVVGLNVLRVSEDDFCAFLSAWTDWLDKSGVADALTHQNEMAA